MMDKKLHFLIIDDSKTVLFEFSKLIQEAGHSVSTLSSCDEAFETIRQQQPDCVLCDLMLPGLNALDFFKLIRKDKNIKQPSFIVISGKQFEYDRRRSLDIGVDAYITKPINRETFVKELIAVIDAKNVLKFWGCRGTFPIPGPKTIRYGGNTNCISLHIANKHHIIFDAGTGIKELSNYLVETHKAPIHAHIFITHPHYDHINGVPYFSPLYRQGNEFDFYGPDQESITLENYLAAQMDSVYFPVKMKEFSSAVNFHSLTEETFMIDDVQVDTILLNHPGRTLGYRVHVQDKIVCYISDNETYLMSDKQRYNEEEVNRLVEFIKGADVLIIDSSFTDEEYKSKINWGHSPLSSVVDVADRAQVKLLCLHHHAPEQTDADIDKKLAMAKKMLADRQSKTVCVCPCEGDEIKL